MLQALLRNARAEGKTSSSPAALMPAAVDEGVECRSFSERITSWMQTPAHQTFTQALQQGMVLDATSSVCDPCREQASIFGSEGGEGDGSKVVLLTLSKCAVQHVCKLPGGLCDFHQS